MLVIISDLHLTDGTTGELLNQGAFEIFRDRLQELATRASWRADGSFRPIGSIDLLLLGDILDLTHSHGWLASAARPWHELQSDAVIRTVDSIVGGILEQNRPALEALLAITQGHAIRVPPADSLGRPVFGAEELPVRVRAHYLVGDHDWLLHVKGARYDAVRQRVIERLGLANSATTPFPHDPYESDELLGVLRRHRVLARHGDLFDPLSFGETREAASLGDALAIELVHRFVVQVTTEFPDLLPRVVAGGLRELPHIRPLLLIPVWLDGLLARAAVRPALRQQFRRLWDRLADDFLQLPFLRQCETSGTEPLVDGLSQAIKFARHRVMGRGQNAADWLRRQRGATSDSYCQHALAEQDFRNRRARYIVYGHTHLAESVPLDASYADGYVLNQIYFNSGTWRPVFRQTQWAPGEQEFISGETLTYVAFYQGDERGGRSFETWSGTLATTAGDNPVRRLDAGRTEHAAQQPIPAPRVPLRAPHFRSPVSHPRTAAPGRS